MSSAINYSKSVVADAVSSNAWIYPLHGILYFASHPSLWKPLIQIFLPTIALSLGVLVFMFTFTYLPQAAVVSVIQLGPHGFVSAIPLVLSESAVIINTLTRAFLLSDKLTDVFDAVLVAQGHSSLVERGRIVRTSGTRKIIGKLVLKPLQRFSPAALSQYLFTLPLQFIPVVGTVVFFTLNGAKMGPSLHARYFQLKGFSETERRSFIHRRRGSYTALGTAALLLNTMPLVGVFLSLTNACGAALFAAKLEGPPAPSADMSERDEQVEIGGTKEQ